MSGANEKFVGRSITAFYSLSQDRDNVPNDFVRLGSLRDKSFGPEWETVDSTADTSAGDVREYLVTYKNFNPSLSGVVSNDDADNQKALEIHINNPPNSQPCGWLRLVRPLSATQNRVYEIFVVFTSYAIESTYDDVVTFSMDTLNSGAGVIITDVTAP